MRLSNMKAYSVLWLSIPIVFVLSRMSLTATLDLKYHDTYFVFDSVFFSLLFSCILAVVGLLYWLMRHQTMIVWMKMIHVGVTIGILLAFQIISLVRSKLNDLGFSTFREINHTLTVLILLFIMCQALLVFNIFFVFFSKRHKQ